MLHEMQHKSSQLHKMTRSDAQSTLAPQTARVALDFRATVTDPTRLDALGRIAEHLSRNMAARQRPAAA